MAEFDKVIERGAPRFTRRQGDLVYEGSNNTLLVLGTDRPSTGNSGVGFVGAPDGKGGQDSGTIHAIAGRKSKDPDFNKDSSFIYISQRTNSDKNLNLPTISGPGQNRPAWVNAANVPAAIVKSDNIRAVFRNSGDARIVNDAGTSFIIISKDTIDSHVESAIFMDAGGVMLEVHKDNRVRLGSLATALNELAVMLKTALEIATTVSNTGNLGAPVPFGGSDLQSKLIKALDDWAKRFVNDDYITDRKNK